MSILVLYVFKSILNGVILYYCLFLSLTIAFLKCIPIFAGAVADCPSLPYSLVSLLGDAIIYLSILLLVDIWAVSRSFFH